MQQNKIKLWPNDMPVAAKEGGDEYVQDGRTYNVRSPELWVYPPQQKTAPGPRTAVVIFPGGSYRRLALNAEGVQTARCLSEKGLVAFLVKYRTREFGEPAPLIDGLRAVQRVREVADTWDIDPDKIGVCGFSAGGHLCASISTHYTNTLFFKQHALEKYGLNSINSKPNFAALLYPGITMHSPFGHVDSKLSLFGAAPTREQIDFYSLEQHVSDATPPSFLVHGNNDEYVAVENTFLYFQALRQKKVPCELHVLQNGPHGFGLGESLPSAKLWPDYFIAWLKP